MWPRFVWLIVVLLGVLLISSVPIYRAKRAAQEATGEPVIAPPIPAPAAEGAETEPAASLPVEAWPQPVPRSGVDASVFYKNAFVLYAALTDEEKKMFRQQPGELDEETSAALFKKIQPIMELLRQAAEADYCEWGLGEPNLEMPLPHLTKAQGLGGLARWNASYRFPSDPQGALSDLRAQARLGDHLADTMIGWLVQMSMEGAANKVLLQNAGMLDEAAARQVQELLQSSTVGQNGARAMATEAASAEAMMKKLAAQTPAERMKQLQMVNAPGEKFDPAIQRMLEDDAALTAEFQFLRQTEHQMAAAMLWPEAQYQAWWKGVEGSLAAHPLAAMTLPSFTGVRTRMQRTQVEQAMLSAGLTLFESGPEQLGRFRDPVTGAAFTYVPKPDGFELRSTFKNKGTPVSMSFTQPK